MIITDIDVWSVVVPERPGSVNSPELGRNDWPDVPKHIVRVNTDEGISGIGETGRGASADGVRRAAMELRGRDVMGMSLQNVFRTVPMAPPATIGHAQDMELGPYPKGYEAFEMAVFDAMGKRLGVPVSTLLGGAVRDSVRVHYWIGQQTPEDSAHAVRTAVGLGFNGIKIKCRLEEPIVERLEAMREAAGPDFKVTVDPSERFYTVKQTLDLAQRLAELGTVEMFEDPIPRDGMSDEGLARYRQMREKLPFPLAITPRTPREALRAVRAGASDYLNLGGSMVGFLKAAAIAEAASIPVWHGSGVDFGIMEHSYLHAASVAPTCVLANDIVSTWVRIDDLVVDGLVFENGTVQVPQSPGLGCELDMDAVEKYRVDL